MGAVPANGQRTPRCKCRCRDQRPDAKPSRESPCPDHTQAEASESLLRGGVFFQLVPQLSPLLLPPASLACGPWLCLVY